MEWSSKIYKPFNAPSVKKWCWSFAQKIKKKYPYLPVEEEEDFKMLGLEKTFNTNFAYQHLYDF